MISIRKLLGEGGVPKDRTSASKWLARNGIPTFTISGNGGEAEAVRLSDLPEEVRRAYTVKTLAAMELDPGSYDAEAHAALSAAPPGMAVLSDRHAAASCPAGCGTGCPAVRSGRGATALLSDDPAQFDGPAHAGSKPGERPEGHIVPVPYDLFVRIYRAKVDAYNAQTGRKSQGCIASGTESYDAAFKALSRGRPKRVLAEEQLRIATLEWSLATVQPDGRVRGKDGWFYGEDMEDGSQDCLLRFTGRKVWVGTNPLDRSEPAIVWNPEDDRLIHRAVHAVVRGAFDDAEGARFAARKKAHIRKATKRIAELDDAAARAQFQDLWTGYGAEDGRCTDCACCAARAGKRGPAPAQHRNQGWWRLQPLEGHGGADRHALPVLIRRGRVPPWH